MAAPVVPVVVGLGVAVLAVAAGFEVDVFVAAVAVAEILAIVPVGRLLQEVIRLRTKKKLAATDMSFFIRLPQ